jgi:hypothetical protein
MTQFFFVPYILGLLSQGIFFRRIFFYFLRAAAVLTAIVGLVVCAGLLKTVLNLPAVGVIGGFVFIGLVIVAFYAVAHIYWTRAGDIRDLADAKFTMIPIYAIMVRTLGEVLASFVAVVSAGGFILFLFAGEQASNILSQVMPINPASGLQQQGNSFIEALGVLVAGAILAILLLAAFYLAAEFISALAEIAISTGTTASNTSAMLAPAGLAIPAAKPVPAPIVSAKPANKVCGACAAINPLGAAFCENCGKPL